MPDAVVVGAGHNGLVAANLLIDAGWSVTVLEEQPDPGGAVRSHRDVHPDYVSDLCSAFYPLGAASPVLADLDLGSYGLRWTHAPAVLAHPTPGGPTAVLHRNLDETVGHLNELWPGDGDAWRRLYGLWQRVGPTLLDAIFTPFPPVRAGARLAAAARAAGGLRLARFLLLPVRRLIEEEFTGGGGLLIAGCAMHADLSPESAGSGLLGWLLAMLGQQVGFPVPEGGAGKLAEALVNRLRARGGELHCSTRVSDIIVDRGRARGVRTADGREVCADRAVLGDVPATTLYGGLVGWEHLPKRLYDDIRRFQWDYSTVKLDWALSSPVPWAEPATSRAGTVHVADDVDEMTEYTADIARGRVPAHPFLLIGQMTTSDASRSPAGTESLWTYTHVPRGTRGDAGGAGIAGRWDEADTERMADRVEARIEALAPGFRDRIEARVVAPPPSIEAHNASLVGGAINGGTMSAHQQLVFRPTPGLARPETPVSGLYLSGASAHPGGAVHGACGSNAARIALREQRGGWRIFAGVANRAGNRMLHPD